MYRFIGKLILIILVGALQGGCISAKSGRVYVDSDRGTGVAISLETKQEDIHIMTVEELALAADVIAKVKTIKTKAISFRTPSGVYSQAAEVKILNLIKGTPQSEEIIIYAKNRRIPPHYQASYEFYDELLVFLKKERDHYLTVNNHFGQMPIYDKIVSGWRQKRDGALNLNISLPYLEAKEKINQMLSLSTQSDGGINHD
jgi:hypothetical protein